MKRQRFLVMLLVVVAVTMLPFYFLDQAGANLRKEQKSSGPELELLRTKLKAVRSLESQVAEMRKSSGQDGRLLGGDPFAEIERELAAAAAKSGMKVAELTLAKGKPVAGLPLLEYTATVKLTGTPVGYVTFLQFLEQHRLIISIPDVSVTLSSTGIPVAPAPGAASPAKPAKPATPAAKESLPPPWETKLILSFYGKP